jgi:hypothetical protein
LGEETITMPYNQYKELEPIYKFVKEYDGISNTTKLIELTNSNITKIYVVKGYYDNIINIYTSNSEINKCIDERIDNLKLSFYSMNIFKFLKWKLNHKEYASGYFDNTSYNNIQNDIEAHKGKLK